MFIFEDTLGTTLAIMGPIIGAVSVTIAFIRWREHQKNKRNNSKDFRKMVKDIKVQREIAYNSSLIMTKDKIKDRKDKIDLLNSLSSINELLKDIKSFIHNTSKMNGRINTRNSLLKLIDESIGQISILKAENSWKKMRILSKSIKKQQNPFDKLDKIIKELEKIKTAE